MKCPFCSMQRHFNMRVTLHVKLISVAIYLFIFSERDRNAQQSYISIFCSVTWDNIWGNTPQSIGSFKQSLKPTVSLLFTPCLFITTFLAFSTRTHTQLQICIWTYTCLIIIEIKKYQPVNCFTSRYKQNVHTLSILYIHTTQSFHHKLQVIIKTLWDEYLNNEHFKMRYKTTQTLTYHLYWKWYLAFLCEIQSSVIYMLCSPATEQYIEQ